MAHGEGHEGSREEGEDERDLGDVARGHQVDSAGEPAGRGVGREKHAQHRQDLHHEGRRKRVAAGE